jgi:hypothetical protein
MGVDGDRRIDGCAIVEQLFDPGGFVDTQEDSGNRVMRALVGSVLSLLLFSREFEAEEEPGGTGVACLLKISYQLTGIQPLTFIGPLWRVRDAGLVDAMSLARAARPHTSVQYRSAETEPGPHSTRGTRWVDDVTQLAATNQLRVEMTGVTSATIWAIEAGLEVTERIRLTMNSSTSATLRLQTPHETVSVDVPAGESSHTVAFAEAACR